MAPPDNPTHAMIPMIIPTTAAVVTAAATMTAELTVKHCAATLTQSPVARSQCTVEQSREEALTVHTFGTNVHPVQSRHVTLVQLFVPLVGHV